MFFSILSVAYPQYALRMNATGYKSFQPNGGGVVCCSGNGIHSYEKFKLHKHADGTYSIESANFLGVFLRMDASENVYGKWGKVNCQLGVHITERFKLHFEQNSTICSIESVAFPGVYLHMDASNPYSSNEGIVHCSDTVGPSEQFHICWES